MSRPIKATPATAATSLPSGRPATDPPVAELKYKAKRYENWAVTGWPGDDRIKLTVFTNDREGSYDRDAEAVRSEKGWKLVWGKRGKVQPKP